MKRFLILLFVLIITWYLFVQSSGTIDFWIPVEVDGNTTVKVKRDFYYEYLELSMKSERQIRAEIRKYVNNTLAYKRWENIEKQERIDSLGLYK